MISEDEGAKKLVQSWLNGKKSLQDIYGFREDEVYAISKMGETYILQGKNAEAQIIFEGLIALNPKNDYYYRALGVIFHKMGEVDKAIAQYGYAIQVNPKSPYAYLNRAEIYITQKYVEKAEKDVKDALQFLDHKDERLSKKAFALLRVVQGL